jgi:hypothetical protein
MGEVRPLLNREARGWVECRETRLSCLSIIAFRRKIRIRYFSSLHGSGWAECGDDWDRGLMGFARALPILRMLMCLIEAVAPRSNRETRAPRMGRAPRNPSIVPQHRRLPPSNPHSVFSSLHRSGCAESGDDWDRGLIGSLALYPSADVDGVVVAVSPRSNREAQFRSMDRAQHHPSVPRHPSASRRTLQSHQPNP